MALLNSEDLRAQLQELAGWEEAAGQLRKQFVFPDFASALHFVVQVGEAAEELNHHPDIDIRYNKVILALVTHDQGGITDLDVRLAKAVEALPATV